MSSYNIAHINVQGVDLIIIPLNSSFGYKTSLEQNEIKRSLQVCASGAGLNGTVIPIWLDSLDRMNFIAPQSYHPYLKSIDYGFVLMNINKTLTCG